jgi:predicted ATP-dependent serine protease
MLFGALNEKMSTAAVNRDDIKNQMAGRVDNEALKKQVNEAAQYEAKVQRAVTARSRASELKALDDVQKKAKVKPKTALAKTQSAMATGAASDSLQRIGGYSGGMKATQALDVAKKQVDILTQVDRKLASIESSAKSGGLVFP